MRAAVIGLGRMGARHLEALDGIDGIELAAVADRSTEALHQACEDAGVNRSAVR